MIKLYIYQKFKKDSIGNIKMPTDTRKNKNVILDLDQTLISAEAEEEYDFKKCIDWYNRKFKIPVFEMTCSI